MELSLSKLPWYGQIGAFVVVCGAGGYGFWHFYVVGGPGRYRHAPDAADGAARRHRAGVATARRLPEFQAQVTQLEGRLENLRRCCRRRKTSPTSCAASRAWRRSRTSRFSVSRRGKVVQQTLYAEIPYRLQAEGTYHNLGRFFDRISKFPRIINVSEISIQAKDAGGAEPTIIAECVATTFVLQEGRPAPRRAAVPKQPSLGK